MTNIYIKDADGIERQVQWAHDTAHSIELVATVMPPLKPGFSYIIK